MGESWADDSRRVRILTIAPDLDLRALPDIARDRSPAGRARLFAFLANLLIARWDRLAPGERTQLAELIAVLWARGTLVDQHRLVTHFAGSVEVPPVLQALIKLPTVTVNAAIGVPVPTASAAPAAVPSPEARPKKSLKITVTHHPIVIQRKTAPAAPVTATAPATTRQSRTAPATAESGAVLPRGVSEQPAAATLFEGAAPEKQGDGIARTEKAGTAELAAAKSAEAADSDGLPSAERAIPAIDGVPESNEGTADSVHADLSVPPRADIPGHDALLAATLLRAAPGRMPAASVSDSVVPVLSAPRDNPHRLTAELLGDVLASGDQARFEVMLASLAGIRAPLLRRMLRDSGDEAFAILARSIGMDEASFVAQWQVWQQGQAEIGRTQAPADRSRRKRISAFFATLTEHQIGRLVQRWRSSDGRVFAASTTSS